MTHGSYGRELPPKVYVSSFYSNSLYSLFLIVCILECHLLLFSFVFILYSWLHVYAYVTCFYSDSSFILHSWLYAFAYVTFFMTSILLTCFVSFSSLYIHTSYSFSATSSFENSFQFEICM